MARIKSSLRRLISVGHGWLSVLGIYLHVGWRFSHWRYCIRSQVRLQPSFTMETESTSIAMKKQTLLLIRHGQTTWNVQQLLPGQLAGIPLTEKGREQVVHLAEALSVLPISAIISSPLERARDTAEIIAQKYGIAVQLEPELVDTDVGDWAGKNYQELNKTDAAWNAYKRDPTVAPAGVETFPQVQQRALAAVERWLTQESIGTYPAFVAHADVVKLLIAHYSGLPAARAGHFFIDNASVSLIELEPEHSPRVVAIGWNPRPGWLKPPTSEHPEHPVPMEEQPKGSE